MSTSPNEPIFSPEKLIIAVLSAGPEYDASLPELLEQDFGPIDYRSGVLPFDYTNYYHREMGPEIKRYFFSFRDLIDPSRLAAIKRRTIELEQRFTVEGRRKINLDPGLLSLGKLILASTKDNAQRIPLSRGIYGEITLIYRRKAFHPLPWTYPDYRSEEYQKILKDIRGILKTQV